MHNNLISRLVSKRKTPAILRKVQRTFKSLRSDTSGNALMIMAFAVVPLFALVGSGLDMGRAYAVQSRLQQACDSGTLAARKELAVTPNFSVATHGPAITTKANRFFNVNFPDRLYNATSRSFQIAIESDSSISGVATAVVPTDVMKMFGKQTISLRATCKAELSVPNTDIMLALDVTGSMLSSNPGDSGNRLSVMKTVVKNFYTTMETAKSSSSRIRYGFVPYSTNVNVGGILKNNWVVNQWSYPSRVWTETQGPVQETTEYGNVTYVSGTGTTTTGGSVPAIWYSGQSGGGGPVAEGGTSSSSSGGGWGYWYCPGAPWLSPSESWSEREISRTPVTNPNGFRVVTEVTRTRNGRYQWYNLSGNTCQLQIWTATNYVDRYNVTKYPITTTTANWVYKDVSIATNNWKGQTAGCMEERSTYEITDYSNVDLSRAKDLDIDLVPTNDPSTQWRPMYSSMVYGRAKDVNNNGYWSVAEVATHADFLHPASIGFAPCPTAAEKLQTWNANQFNRYVDGLTAAGNTYHDIGMLWAARLLSPTGLFASENADASASRPTSRHLIFMTDGQTEPFDISYGAYGVEPLSQRRWRPTSALTLTQTVEKRFAFACEEAKKKRITVWLIAFGTTINPIMSQCAGPGRSFSASNAGELQTAFLTISKSIGSLRLSE